MNQDLLFMFTFISQQGASAILVAIILTVKLAVTIALRQTILFFLQNLHGR